jgi:hypothetical protein
MRLFQRLGNAYIYSVPYITFSSAFIGGLIALENEIMNPYSSVISPNTLCNITKYVSYGACYGITYPVSIPIHLLHVFYWSKHKYSYTLCIMRNYPSIK